MQPPIDASSQVSSSSGRRDGIWTEISFAIPCNSTDAQDIAIHGQHYLIFAIGDLVDGDVFYHGGPHHRGPTPYPITFDCTG